MRRKLLTLLIFTEVFDFLMKICIFDKNCCILEVFLQFKVVESQEEEEISSKLPIFIKKAVYFFILKTKRHSNKKLRGGKLLSIILPIIFYFLMKICNFDKNTAFFLDFPQEEEEEIVDSANFYPNSTILLSLTVCVIFVHQFLIF